MSKSINRPCAGVAALLIFALACASAELDMPRTGGTWTVAEYDQNGAALPADIVKKMKVTIADDRIVIKPRVVVQYQPIFDAAKKNVEVVFNVEADKSDEAGVKFDAPKQRIDLVWRGARGESKTMPGMYVLEDDTLKICFALAGKNRPKKFPEAPKVGLVRMVLQRPEK